MRRTNPMKDPLTSSASASHDSSASKLILTTKAGNVVSTKKWALPKDNNETRQEQPQNSSVEHCLRQGVEEKANEWAAMSEPEEAAVQEKIAKKDGGWSFSYNPSCCAADVGAFEDVGAFDNLDIENIKEQLSAEVSAEESPEEPVEQSPELIEQTLSKNLSRSLSTEKEEQVMEEATSDNGKGHTRVKKKKGSNWKKSLVKKLSRKFSANKKSTPDNSQNNIAEKMAAITEESASSKEEVAEDKVDPLQTVSLENTSAQAAASNEKASFSLMDNDEADEKSIENGEPNDEGVPDTCSNTSPKNVETPSKKKPISLARIFSFGACGVKAVTPTDFNIDRIESDGYEGGSEKTNENKTPRKSLFSCGIVPTSRRAGVFGRLQSVQSDAAVGVTTDLDDEEIMEMAQQVHLSSHGEEDIASLETYGSSENRPEPSEGIKMKKSSSSENKVLRSHSISFHETKKTKSKEEMTEERTYIKMEKSSSSENKLQNLGSIDRRMKKSSSSQDELTHLASVSTMKKSNTSNSSRRTRTKQVDSKEEKRAVKGTARKDNKSRSRASSSAQIKPDIIERPNEPELFAQTSSEEQLPSPKATELDEILQISKSDSTSTSTAASSLTDDTFVAHMEAKFDLYNQKFELIQKFGKLLETLKKEQGK